MTLQNLGTNLFPDLPSEDQVRVSIAIVIILSLLLMGLIVDSWCLFWHSSHKAEWREQKTALQRLPWRWNDGAAVFFPLGILYGILLLLGVLTQKIAASSTDMFQYLLLCIPTTIIQMAAVFLVWRVIKIRGTGLKDAFGVCRTNLIRNILLGLFFFLATVPPLLLSAILSQILLTKVGIEVSHQDIVYVFSNAENPVWFLSYLLILASVTAPFVEELLFRGIALPLLAQRAGTIGAVTMVSLFFSVMHLHLPSMLPLFVISFSLSIAYVYSGSLIVPIVAHAFFNTANVLILSIVKDVTSQ